MTRSIWIALVWLMSVGAGGADTPTDRVRVLLDQGDIAGLEQEFGRLAEAATESQNADALRDIHNRLFDTSHPKRSAVVEQWHQEMPNSVFALSAATWAAINKVERFSNDLQPYHSPENVPPARLQQWVALSKQARDLADGALGQADGYVPALDAWLLSRQFRPRQGARYEDAYAALMLAAPDRASMLRIVDASYAGSMHASEDVLRACLTYAETAVDYSADACMIEASIKYYLRADLRQMAEDLIKEADDPIFADERMRSLLKARDLDQTANAKMIELHRSLPFGEANPRDYLRVGFRVAYDAKAPEYRVEFRVKTLGQLAALLADDPLNHVLLWTKAELHLETFNSTKAPIELTKARAAWETAMIYGGFNSEIWLLGTKLVEANPSPEAFAAQQVFFENAIAHHNQSILYVLYYFDFMQTARAAAEIQVADQADASDAAAAFLERLKCPQLKAARSAFAQCRVTDAAMGLCDPTQGYYKHVPQILAEGADGSCPVIADLPLSDLQYSATPLEAINLPWPSSKIAQD